MNEAKTYKHSRLGKMTGRIVRDNGKFLDFVFSEEQVIGDGDGGVELVQPNEEKTLKSGSLKEVKNG